MTATETTTEMSPEEITRLQDGARILGRVLVDLCRTLEAARIELIQGKPGNALEWILNATEPVDGDSEDQWNGTETAQEWFDRTDERASGATPAPSPAEPEMAGQLPLPEVIPPGTYAGGGRSPIVYAFLCPPCAGYAPMTDEDYSGFLSGRCQGCGADSRELHRFQALILSAANSGCMCTSSHRRVTGDLPTEEAAMGVLIEVRTRP